MRSSHCGMDNTLRNISFMIQCLGTVQFLTVNREEECAGEINDRKD